MLSEKVYYAHVTTTENAPNLESIAMGQPGYVLAMPTFANVEEERAYRKSRLAGALRIFGRLGFGEGVAGHITVRDPELTDHFWVNPFGLSFRHMRVSDLLLVNHHGEVVHGTMPVNRAAFVIHSAIHSARPEVIAAAHAHSVHGGAVVFDVEAGKEMAEKFPTGKAAIHLNHGLFTVGSSVEEAAFWFLSMDRSCQAQLLAMAAGTPKLIKHEYAQYTREQTCHSLAGWFQFQPLWQEICRTDPELFD